MALILVKTHRCNRSPLEHSASAGRPRAPRWLTASTNSICLTLRICEGAASGAMGACGKVDLPLDGCSTSGLQTNYCADALNGTTLGVPEGENIRVNNLISSAALGLVEGGIRPGKDILK